MEVVNEKKITNKMSGELRIKVEKMKVEKKKAEMEAK